MFMLSQTKEANRDVDAETVELLASSENTLDSKFAFQ
jgi:hypothetical protein